MRWCGACRKRACICDPVLFEQPENGFCCGARFSTWHIASADRRFRITATVDVRNHSEASSAYRSTQLYISGHQLRYKRKQRDGRRSCPLIKVSCRQDGLLPRIRSPRRRARHSRLSLLLLPDDTSHQPIRNHPADLINFFLRRAGNVAFTQLHAHVLEFEQRLASGLSSDVEEHLSSLAHT